MSFNPNLPATNAPILSAELREQFNALKALIDGLVPIGIIVGWHKNFPSTPPLVGTWLECNGQTVNDVESPYHGMSLPDLNGAQGGVPVFQRGGIASGGSGGSETHSHGLLLNINGGLAQQGFDIALFPPGNYMSDPASSLPTYFEVVWVMRVK